MDLGILCYGFVALAIIVIAVKTIDTGLQFASAGRRDGEEWKPLYTQARSRSQAELLTAVPTGLRRKGLNRAIYTANFTGQRQYTHLELFPGELYEYVQVFSEGKLIREYVTQNGYALTEPDDTHTGTANRLW